MDEFDAGGGSAVSQVREVYGGSDNWMLSVGAGGGSGGTGHWEFNPEEIDALIKQWEGIVEDLEADRRQIRGVLRGMIAPSEDENSISYASRVHDGLGSMQDLNRSMLVYAQEYLDRLNSAKEKYKQSDSNGANALGASDV